MKSDAGMCSFIKQKIGKISNKNLLLSIAILVFVLLVGAIFVPSIYSSMNLINVMRMVSIMGFIAIGETLILLIGEIDISVGSIMSLSLVLGGFFLPLGTVPALFITLTVGGLLGMINGFAIVKGNINSLIMTLGTLSVFAGLALVVTRGKATYLYDYDLYLWLGKGYILGIPVPVVFFFGITGAVFFLLTYTKFGRELFFTGANPTAAHCSGIKTNRIKIFAFTMAGVMAAITGPFIASQTNRITPTLGVGYELTAIAVTVLGGTLLAGGKGNVLGTLVGAMTYGFLLNILSLSGIGTYMEQFLKGGLLILIVIIFQNITKEQY